MSTLDVQILKLGESRSFDKLQSLINKTPTAKLVSTIEKLIISPKYGAFWNFLLLGFSSDKNAREKRFACVMSVLKQLSTVELTYKQTYDILTRLFLDLPSLNSDELNEIVEYSIDCLKLGDAKCVGWKDLLPETLNVLANLQELTVNGIKMTGPEYKANAIKNLCIMKWPNSVLTAIAHMFREMKINDEQVNTILKKFCETFHEIEPIELAPLTFQLFSLCNTASQILTIILALQKYFYKYHYKKLFADMESDTTDFDSIDKYSDKEIREAEETVLHHLNYCTQFKISETQMCAAIRNLAASPDTILTPFVLSAILTMTRTNRDPDARLTSSVTLPLLRAIIKNNEDEKYLSKTSSWCRDTLQSPTIDLDNIFTVLIDQNKDGKDVVTPALVNLGFTLLKTKNCPELSSLGIAFFQKFIKKRFLFGQGIVQKVAEWMIIEQEDGQYADCLSKLSVSDTFTLSECVKTVKYVLDFFLWLPGHQAMKMMPFLFPILKISHVIRDDVIEVLKKAIYSKDTQKCQMGVYGFCMLLKQLNNHNSQRGLIGGAHNLTQQSISGFSLMSQATLGNRNNPQRFFDMLTLEIIGLLRNCFRQPLEIKEVLYENIIRAIELNPKLIPHVLQFIDWHFRSYFNVTEENFEIHFSKVIRGVNENKDIEVLDNLGRLLNLVASCVILCETFELEYDASVMGTLLSTLAEKITEIDFAELQLTGPLSHKSNVIGTQYLNVVESLMAYLLWTSKKTNSNVETISKLFKHSRKVFDEMKRLANSANKKPSKKGRGDNADDSTQNVTINGTVVKKIILKQTTVWELPTFERFLRLLYDDFVSFATPAMTAPLRKDIDLIRYVTSMCAKNAESIRQQPEYKQIKHSRRIFTNIIECGRLVYERCIKNLPKLWTNLDVTVAYNCCECFRQLLLTVKEIYRKRADEFLKGIDFNIESTDRNRKKIVTVIQEMVDKCMEKLKEDDDESGEDLKLIPVVLFQCLEVLYGFISHDDRLTIDSYKWMLSFCQKYELKRKEYGIIHKLMFEQRQKTCSGQFYNCIAMHFEKLLGQIDEELELELEFELKSITLETSDSCLTYMVNMIRKQLDEIEYFTLKAKSLHTKIKLTSDEDQELAIQSLKAIERSICSQFIHISNSLFHLSNACIPLGSCMDNLVKVLMQTYVCLTNLTKHLILRHSTIPISFQGIRFDQVLKISGKPLEARIYNIISYIESNILEEPASRKKHNPKAEKAKILREAKFIPKLILRVENFNKFVILLSKKTNSHLSHYLHMGQVRYFSIKTTALKNAIDETLSRSSQIDSDESLLEGAENDDNTETTNTQNDDASSDEREDAEQPTKSESMELVLRNLAEVNQKSKKRKGSKTLSPVKLNNVEPPPKKPRGRPSKYTKKSSPSQKNTMDNWIRSSMKS